MTLVLCEAGRGDIGADSVIFTYDTNFRVAEGTTLFVPSVCSGEPAPVWRSGV